MRGKVDPEFAESVTFRITPAYAGKSFGSWCQPLSNRDHPRLCGEKNSVLGDVREVSGSPPPMRGKGQFLIVGVCAVGITPAYAGKSQQRL